MKTATALGLAGALLLGAGAARAQGAPPGDRQKCVDAYESAQVAMRRANLASAREQIRACLQESCPGVLRAEWRGLKVAGHVEEVLKAVKALKKAA